MGNATSLFVFGIIGLAYWPTMLWLLFKRISSGKPISKTIFILLQIPIIGALTTALVPKSFPWLMVAPIYVFHISIQAIQKYWMFFEPFIGLSFAVAFFTLVLLAFSPLWLNRWTPSLTVIVFFGMFCVIGEIEAKKLQDAAISKWNFDCISRKSFIHSISIANEEFQFDLHTSAMKGTTAYGWSFMTLDFYEIPENVAKNLGPIC